MLLWLMGLMTEFQNKSPELTFLSSVLMLLGAIVVNSMLFVLHSV